MLAIGSDHAARGYKDNIKSYLKTHGIDYVDVGAHDDASCDYPDFALKVAEKVASGECEKGILVCGTGIGMSIAANKVRGIRCALCPDVFSAVATRRHNDANVLALGERTMGMGNVLDIVEAFLTTPFSGDERHVRRIAKISEIENKYFK